MSRNNYANSDTGRWIFFHFLGIWFYEYWTGGGDGIQETRGQGLFLTTDLRLPAC